MPECRVCKKIKVPDSFPDNKTYTSGKASLCKECLAAYAKEHRKQRPYQVKAWKYKVNEEWLKEWAESRTECEICGTTEKRLVIDHNHQTGHLRGMLCDLCNKGIGALKEDPNILRRAVAYLEDTDGCD